MVLVFPMLMFGGSICKSPLKTRAVYCVSDSTPHTATGVITLYKSSIPGSNLWSNITVDFGLPYFTISVALNVLLTFLICLRLLRHSQEFNLTTGSSSKGLYRMLVAVLVESCALYALFSLLFIGTYASGNYMSDLFLPILSQVQVSLRIPSTSSLDRSNS